MAFGNIYGQGGSSLISRLLGQDDREGTGRVSSFCFYVALTTGVVLAALMMLFRVPLLGILGATAETMPHAEAYYTVLAIGAPATVLKLYPFQPRPLRGHGHPVHDRQHRPARSSTSSSIPSSSPQ